MFSVILTVAVLMMAGTVAAQTPPVPVAVSGVVRDQTGVDAFNVLNHVNYSNFVGTRSSPRFGQPVGALPSRQLQFSARIKF
jgi:hypothetical protein